MNMIAGIGHNGGPPLQFKDAQQAAAFVTPALYRTHAMIEQVYPSFDYAGLVPVNMDGDMWDVGTLVYSGDIAGAADYIGRKAFDIPNVGVNFQQGISNFHLAGAGYELSVGEVNRFARMVAQNAGLSDPDGTSLGARKAEAATMVAAKFVYDRVIRGSTEKGFTGLVNDTRVPTAAAPSGTSWNTATPAQMLADVNAALGDVYFNSRNTALANTLMLPDSAFFLINNAQLPNGSVSVLTFLKANNSYTAITGAPLDIRSTRELEAAGAGGTRRMMAFAKDPANLEFFYPGMFEFMPEFPTSSMTWRVDGVMNVGQLEIYRPKTMSYRDGI